MSYCLKALTNQTFPITDFEIIIVNNNPEDELPKDLQLPANCKVIEEIKQGSYAARNAGLQISSGEIIGFTDSDCIPENTWIANAVDHFKREGDCCRIAGKIHIFFSGDQPSRAEMYDKLYAFNQYSYAKNSGTSVTANMFTYKKIFDEVGLFDEKLMSGGDFYWGTLAHNQGFRIDFVNTVIVNHPARQSLQLLVKKEKRVGGSQALFLPKSKNHAVNVFYFFKSLFPRVHELKYIIDKGKSLPYFG